MMPPLPAPPSLSQLSSLLPCRLHIEGRRTNYVTFQISISIISIITILLLTTTNIIIIIITRPKPAYGRQGLAGSWGQDTDKVSNFWVFLTSHFTQLGIKPTWDHS